MAIAPTAAAAPMPADAGAMPPGGGAPELDAGNPDEATEPEVIATILKNQDGTYMLVAGDEPDPGMPGEEGAEPAPEGKTFDTPQALMRGVMELLNPTTGAEEGFAAGFKGEPSEPMK